jgi:tRNA 2-thiocytidine biosynthesis protein TtcA
MDIEQQRIKLNRKMLQSAKTYQLLEPNDKIMVAISGGKDSYTLLDLLWRAKSRLPFDFEIVAVHLDQQQPGYDGKALANWLANSGIPHEILSVDTYSIVKELTPDGGTFCAPCSRLRRGILYSAAERLQCNKIALGHHRDDALETLMMNLFYSGKLQAMPAQYLTDDGRFKVIRPLIECGEKEIAEYAQAMAFPILPCNLCGSQDGLKRDQMQKLLDAVEKTHPNVREVMLASIKNVKPSHLLDPKLLGANANLQTQETTNEAQDTTSEAQEVDLPAISGLVQIEG